MTEPLDDVHLKSIADNIMAMADHTRAMLKSTPTLRRRVKENTLLLRRILDLLPPLPNKNSPDATEVVPQVAGSDLLNQRPDQLVTVTAAGDRHPEISGDLKESVILLSSYELAETEILDDSNVFDQMPERMCIAPAEIIESVEPEPVPENEDLLPTPHPNSMIARYEDYPVCSFVVSTLTNSYTLRFPFCNFSIVDEYLCSPYLPHASECLRISTEFERCFMSSILRDRWGLLLTLACINFKLFDPALWVMRPTHDLGKSKAFDPDVANQSFAANQLIVNDVCVVIDFNSVLVVIAYSLTKKVSRIDRKQDFIFSFGVGNFAVYLLNVVANFDEASQVLFQDGPSCLTQHTMADEFDNEGSNFIVDVKRVLQMEDFNEAGLWATSSDYNAANLDTLCDFVDKILDSMLPLLGVMRPNHGFDDCKSFDPGIYEYLLNANRLSANKLSVALVQHDKISTGILMHVGTSPLCLFSVMFLKPLIHGNEDMVEAIDEYVVGQLKAFAGMKLAFAIKKVSRLEYTEDEQTKIELLKEKFEGLCKVTKVVLGDKWSRATTTMNSIHNECYGSWFIRFRSVFVVLCEAFY